MANELLLDDLQNRWADYLMESLDADDLADDVRDAGIRDRLFIPDEHVLISPVMMDASVADAYAGKLHRFGQIMIKVISKNWDSDSAGTLAKLGYSVQAVNILHRTGLPERMPFGRWDILAGPSGWQVLELNVGGATAGHDDRGVQQVYDRCATALMDGNAKRMQVAPYQSLRRFLPQDIGAGVFVSDDDDELNKSPLSAQVAARSLEHLTGEKVQVIPASELFATSKTPGVVFELFTLRDCQRHPERYKAYIDALAAREFVSINPIQNDLLMNKAALALTYQAMEQGKLSVADKDIVRELLPWTAILDAAHFDGIKNRPQQQTVLKASNGFGGLDVHCGWMMADKDWQALLRDAVSDGGSFVAQQRVDGVPLPLVAMSPRGAFVEFQAPPVLGIFCDGGQYGGGFARASMNGAAVVNAHNGAAVGAIRLWAS